MNLGIHLYLRPPKAGSVLQAMNLGIHLYLRPPKAGSVYDKIKKQKINYQAF